MIVWRDSFSIDGGVIDADHKALIAIINEFTALSGGIASLARLKACLAGLRKYTLDHFAREERVMRTIGYPNIDRHRKSHRDIVVVLDEIIADFRVKVTRSDNDHRDIHDRTRDLLRIWLVNHILSTDCDLRAYVEDYRADLARAVTPRKAEGDGADEAPS